eukprot:gene8275-biopygen10140
MGAMLLMLIAMLLLLLMLLLMLLMLMLTLLIRNAAHSNMQQWNLGYHRRFCSAHLTALGYEMHLSSLYKSEAAVCRAPPTEQIANGGWFCSPSDDQPAAVGSSCFGICNVNSVLVGDLTSVCTAVNTWSPEILALHNPQLPWELDLGIASCQLKTEPDALLCIVQSPCFLYLEAAAAGPAMQKLLGAGFQWQEFARPAVQQGASCSTQPPLAIARGNWSCPVPVPHLSSCSLVSCDINARPSGTFTADCFNGVWDVSKATGTCNISGCFFPPALPSGAQGWNCSGAQADANGVAAVGVACTATCGPSSSPSGPLSTTCLPSGNWSSLGNSSCIPQCSSPPLLANTGARSCSSNGPAYNVGSTCNYSCAAGLTAQGVLATSCSVEGWSPITASCVAAQCATLPTQGIFNMVRWDCNGGMAFNQGTTCSVVCATGFSLSVGRSSAVCVDGVWSQVESSCIPSREQCIAEGLEPDRAMVADATAGCRTQPTVQVANGSWSCPSVTVIGQSCAPTCNSGFIGSDGLSLTCRDNATWQPPSLAGLCLRADTLRLEASPLVSGSTGRCLEASGVSGNQRLALADCNNSITQQWQYYPWDRSIRPTYSANLCMATAGGAGSSFTPVVLSPCLPVTPSHQQWMYDSSRGGTLTPRNSARVCLDLDDQQRLIILASTGGSSQRWTAGRQGS